MPTTWQQIRPALLGAGGALLFYFSGFFVFWTPLPLLYLALKHDRVTWRLGFLLTLFLSLVVYFWLLPEGAGSPPLDRVRFFGLAYLFFYLACAFFLILGFEQRWPWVRWGWRGGLGITAAVFAALFLLQGGGLVDIFEFWGAVLSQAQKVMEELSKRPDIAVDLVVPLQKGLAFIPKLFPSLLFAFAVTVMALNVSALKLLKRTASSFNYLGPFQKLQIPPVCVWALIGGGGLFFLNEYLFGLEALKVLALNAVLAALFVYFLQGLSILAFFTGRFSPLFRIGIYGLVLLFLQVMGLVLVGVGVADAWLNFRRLK